MTKTKIIIIHKSGLSVWVLNHRRSITTEIARSGSVPIYKGWMVWWVDHGYCISDAPKSIFACLFLNLESSGQRWGLIGWKNVYMYCSLVINLPPPTWYDFFFYRLESIINIWGSIQLRINIPYYFLSADSIKSQQRSYEGKLLLLLPLTTANFVRDTFTECC